MTRHLDLGKEGERLAADFLKGRGYHILKQNYRCKAGEIDLVACQGGMTCFIEVKTRDSSFEGSPLESITRRKQRKLSRAALSYLQEHGENRPARFDIVTVDRDETGRPVFDLVPDAFELSSPY